MSNNGQVWHSKLIAKITASTIIIGCGGLLTYSAINELELMNGVKELSLLLLGGAIAFLWKE